VSSASSANHSIDQNSSRKIAKSREDGGEEAAR
jgi:hypothetical protein